MSNLIVFSGGWYGNNPHAVLGCCDVIKVKGRIDSATAPNFGAALTSLTDQGRYHIVIDMSDVEFISSAGLRY